MREPLPRAERRLRARIRWLLALVALGVGVVALRGL
jgi:hypothetical protein